MKKLVSLACMGVLCLLLSHQTANAQVSRKGGKDQPKVILKKDKAETSDSEDRNGRTRTETNRDRTSTPSRTKTDRRTYPDRRREPSTQQDRKERPYPETENRYPRKDRPYPIPESDRRERDRDREYGGYRKSSDHHCDHPGKGRHLGWHKQKNKHKKKGKGHRHK